MYICQYYVPVLSYIVMGFINKLAVLKCSPHFSFWRSAISPAGRNSACPCCSPEGELLREQTK